MLQNGLQVDQQHAQTTLAIRMLKNTFLSQRKM